MIDTPLFIPIILCCIQPRRFPLTFLAASVGGRQMGWPNSSQPLFDTTCYRQHLITFIGFVFQANRLIPHSVMMARNELVWSVPRAAQAHMPPRRAPQVMLRQDQAKVPRSLRGKNREPRRRSLVNRLPGASRIWASRRSSSLESHSIKEES